MNYFVKYPILNKENYRIKNFRKFNFDWKDSKLKVKYYRSFAIIASRVSPSASAL